MSSRSMHSVLANINALADGVYDALIRDDIPHAMHLSWHLMQQQPYCPLQLQAQAVLVHSAASLSMGGDVVIIEGNLQNMIKRISCILSKMPMQGAEAPEVVRALNQLRAAATSLRVPRKPTVTSSSRHHHCISPAPSKTNCLDLDLLVEGFGRMGLGRKMGDMVVIREDEEESDEGLDPRRMNRPSYPHSSWRHQATRA